MLRSLVSEVVRRRLWPIPVAAILIAIAAPLLFMKSASVSPADSAVPPVAAPGELPAAAKRFVTTSDKAATPRSKARRRGQDPFTPPAGTTKARQGTASTTAPATTASTATVSTPASGSVAIRNSDGSTATMQVPKTTTKPASTKKATSKKATSKRKTTATVTAPEPSTDASDPATVTYVDVRFGKRQNSMIRHRVPRLQTFRAGGRVAAMFTHLSTTRDVAVFAIAPSTEVAGDVDCRKVKGVCRYVDIPAGSYARLRMRAANGSLISRRLDVVRIRRLPLAGNEDARPRATTLDTAKCLLRGLLKLPSSLPSISVDACD